MSSTVSFDLTVKKTRQELLDILEKACLRAEDRYESAVQETEQKLKKLGWFGRFIRDINRKTDLRRRAEAMVAFTSFNYPDFYHNEATIKVCLEDPKSETLTLKASQYSQMLRFAEAFEENKRKVPDSALKFFPEVVREALDDELYTGCVQEAIARSKRRGGGLLI